MWNIDNRNTELLFQSIRDAKRFVEDYYMYKAGRLHYKKISNSFMVDYIKVCNIPTGQDGDGGIWEISS